MKISYAVIYWDINTEKFLVVHPTHEEFWSMPKGRMEDGDMGDGAKAASREMLEETNVTVDYQELAEAGRFGILQERQKRRQDRQKPGGLFL